MIFIVDFDGTLSPRDSVDALLERFAPDAWHAIETEWVEGRITAHDCMRRQMALLEASEAQMDRFFRSIRLDPGFQSFLDLVSTRARVAIVSDGIGRAIHTALQVAGITGVPVFSNRLVLSEGRWTLEFPHGSERCDVGSGVCKCEVMRGLRVTPSEPSILIGDGRSDQCVAGRVDYVFAKDSLARFCERQGIPFTEFSYFSEINAVISRWRDGDLDEVPSIFKAVPL
jgi:2,3-diketo-5-methylthio-1-phosphopentane phosphatase